ncbi:MAG: type II toxin-antitoxin system Phd/YefM family antitoxin [Candidatus Competibacteraceae bacterium]
MEGKPLDSRLRGNDNLRKSCIHDAKTQFSKLIELTQAGEEFIIAKAGKPVARLIPISKEPRKRQLGLLDGAIQVPDDFNAPLPDDVLATFEGHN